MTEAADAPIAFERVCILGVGLLGASLGLAMKAQRLTTNVIGVGRRRESLDVARSMGAIDAYSLDPAEVVAEADLVVVATPAALVIPMLDALRPALKPEALVTDVASTKAEICQHAQAIWPSPRRFVGCHPMAGSEKFGPEHATANFYEDSVCLVEAGEDIDASARERIVALWESVGARVVSVTPEAHDAMLAMTSHIPHVYATLLAQGAAAAGEVRDVIGNGFRDTTRIAAARPEIWRDICMTNRSAILTGLRDLKTRLEAFEEQLGAGDADAVEAFFAAGNAARQKALGE